MDAADKRMLEREALRNMIQQWNANRLDLFALSEPNENLEFHGVMRFYFQDSGQKIATKCIRVASDATVSDVIETLIEKFRPDMRMLSLGSYSLWETHGPDDERKLEPHEKPLLVQLNWHADDREGRFLLKCLTGNEIPSSASDKGDQNFKRKLSKREKKELKKKEKLSRLKSDTNDENRPVAEKLYTELPETSFMRSISNPEAVMRRRRQQKLGRKLQQFKSKDGGPDTGGTLRIYGGILRPDVSYITLLLSVNDSAATVLRETLDKYGMGHHDPHQYCIVQEDKSDNTEYILEDDECPLALMNMTRSSIMFHVRRRPADSQPRRRKKKTAGHTGTGSRPGNDPVLIEVAPDSTPLENGRRLRITDALEVGSGNGTALQLYGPSIQSRHCVVAPADGGGYTVTPLHPDAQVYLNGHRVLHTQRLQHGCLLKFGRVSTFRFMDPAQENMMNRNLAQSQHYGSGSIYDRSGASPGETSGAMSPTSVSSQAVDAMDGNGNADAEYMRTVSPVHDAYRHYHSPPYNNNTLKLDNESLLMSHHDSKDDNTRDEHSVSTYNDEHTNNRTGNSQYKDNYETTFDLDGNVETKSICSAKSGGSGHDNRMSMRSGGGGGGGGQEAILPAVLEFPESGQAQFLAAVITCLDPHAPAFKLAPVYTLYLCARYRASTHYRPELTPTERAQKLTNFLHHVAYLIHSTVQERCKQSAAQAFWMANASEFLHFLKYDRHISSFSTQAQELLSQTVEASFSNLVSCFQAELSPALETLMSPSTGEPGDATAATLRVLAGAQVLLRLCRVNAALTLQLFSSLFYYINSVCFNKLVSEPGLISPSWGVALTSRLALLSAWALRQGSEIAADCQLAKIYQAARLIQRTYRSGGEVVSALSSCSKLNSVQVRALLAPLAPPDAVEAGAAAAARLADELCRADGREVRLHETAWLDVDLMIPCDGFSAEVVRGVPPGLVEFVVGLQRQGLCRLAAQAHARGDWAVYLTRDTHPAHHPRHHIVQLHKNANGMGLSIVAAKGAGQSKLGIYIKSVVPGGAAAADGRLAAGDQLLSVDGQSLVGITQEKAAEYLVRTGPTVTLEVAKQGAMLHGLATLLHQPATQYNQRQEAVVDAVACLWECERWRRNSGTFTNTHPALLAPASPRSELATAGYGRGARPVLASSGSSSSSETWSGGESGARRCDVPLLVVRSPSPPSPPASPAPPRPRPPPPVFTFTCEDYDSVQPPSSGEESSSSSSGVGAVPAGMAALEPRCTGRAHCASACSCCRSPTRDSRRIPYIDAGGAPRIRALPAGNTRTILPDDPPLTADATCQTPNEPPVPSPVPGHRSRQSRTSQETIEDRPKGTIEDHSQESVSSRSQESGSGQSERGAVPLCSSERTASMPPPRRLELTLDVRRHADTIETVHSRLRRTLLELTGLPVMGAKETPDESTDTSSVGGGRAARARPLDAGEGRSWRSPDELRAGGGRVRALTRAFDAVKLRYCARSSPELRAVPARRLPASASLAHLPAHTDTLSEDEVQSILVQLEDWSKFGSRGSEDTLAQGNEFEVPNLPSETDAAPSSSSPTRSGARRASERDLPARLAAEPVKPSKSTPALHHHVHHHQPHHSPSSVAEGNADLWAHKSRSTHNLAATNHDGFYQNVATLANHNNHLQDRWSSVRSSGGSSRPHSAHFSPAPDSPMHVQTNQTSVMSARAAKLAELSEEATRRELALAAQRQNHIIGPGAYNGSQQSIQPMSPTMHQQPGQHQNNMQQQQNILQQQQHHMQQQQQYMQQQQQHMQQQQQQVISPSVQHMPPTGHQQHSTPQRYEWHQPSPSPQRFHPPVAPKPQQTNSRTDNMDDEYFAQSQQQHPQPQTATIEPEEERYVASALEPPSVALVGGASAASEVPAAANPWVREEAERQAELRRAAVRARRDAAIAHLLALGPARTPAQSQQLRALQLERDFERRATQHDQEERGAADGEIEDEEHITPEPPAPLPPHSSPHPPKSILKTNTPRTDITNGYTQDRAASPVSVERGVCAAVSALTLTAPPAPPARGSSFAVMANRARPPADVPAATAAATPAPATPTNNNNTATHQLSPSSGMSRDKRVSFEERPPPPASSPPPLSESAEPDTPGTPSEPTTPTTPVTHTPGVIGAQEVYKDPRARRLAEQQQQQQQMRAAGSDPPEQLSFKEKMKMFALESGEPTTPKDKVKISRAQRDIDAVH